MKGQRWILIHSKYELTERICNLCEAPIVYHECIGAGIFLYQYRCVNDACECSNYWTGVNSSYIPYRKKRIPPKSI